MGFNYASEKKKFDAQWKRNSEWYCSEGMSEEAIQKIKDFDWAVFCSERVYRNHTQTMPDEINSSISDLSKSSLFAKYPIAPPIKHCRKDAGRNRKYQGAKVQTGYRPSSFCNAEIFYLCQVFMARFSWGSNNLSVSFSIEDFSGKYRWIENIDNPQLATKIKALSKDYIEILTMLIEGYSQTEIAEQRHQHRSAICNKIARIKKLLK